MDARASAGQRPEPVTVSSSLHRSICVLFSGGIDCSLLAALLCKVLEEHGRSTTVELANVSFTDDVERLEREKGPELETLLPDRFTACRRVRRPSRLVMSFAELLSLYPRQRGALGEVNGTNEEMMEKEAAILACVSVGSVVGCEA